MADWEEDLKRFLGQAGVKAQMESWVASNRRRGVRFGGGAGGTVDDEEQAREIVEKEILPRIVAAIQSRIPSMDKDMFKTIAAPEVNSEGAYVFHLVLDPAKTWRDSLYNPNGEGLDNVVAYLSHGAKPLKHSVFGYQSYRGVLGGKTYDLFRKYYIPAGYTRQPDPFLETTMNILNGEFEKDGVTVILDDSYLPEGS